MCIYIYTHIYTYLQQEKKVAFLSTSIIQANIELWKKGQLQLLIVGFLRVGSRGGGNWDPKQLYSPI